MFYLHALLIYSLDLELLEQQILCLERSSSLLIKICADDYLYVNLNHSVMYYVQGYTIDKKFS